MSLRFVNAASSARTPSTSSTTAARRSGSRCSGDTLTMSKLEIEPCVCGWKLVVAKLASDVASFKREARKNCCRIGSSGGLEHAANVVRATASVKIDPRIPPPVLI